MVAAGEAVSGRCLCGAARYTARLRKAAVDACHCGMCRRWSSGPAMAVETDDLRFADGAHVTVFRSSAAGERIFCTTCGSNLAWRAPDGPYQAVAAFTLDLPDDLPFLTEIFIDEKPAVYSFAGERARLAGAALGTG